MRFIFGATSMLLLLGGYSMVLREREVPSVVHLPIQAREIRNPILHDRMSRKRDPTLTVTTEHAFEGDFLCNVTLGSPPQNLTLQVSTYSPFTYVNTPDAAQCTSGKCVPFGTYDSAISSTSVFVNSSLAQSNDNWIPADLQGNWTKDALQIGEVQLDDFLFGTTNSSDKPVSVLGVNWVGPAKGYLTVQPTVSLPYALAERGIIHTPSFSMWISDLESGHGSILFGGVNTAYYTGDLRAQAFSPDGKADGIHLISFGNGLGLQDGSGNDSYFTAGTFVLDMGRQLSYLSNSSVSAIWDRLGVFYDAEQDIGFISCDQREKNYTFSLTFAYAVIEVPMSEMVVDWNSTTCVFGMQRGGVGEAGFETTWYIGSTFLRSTYLVCDLENQYIAIAPRNPTPGKDRILEIGPGSNYTSIPNAIEQSVPPNPTATPTTTTTLSSATSSSKGHAALPTLESRNLLAGFAAAGLLVAL